MGLTTFALLLSAFLSAFFSAPASAGEAIRSTSTGSHRRLVINHLNTAFAHDAGAQLAPALAIDDANHGAKLAALRGDQRRRNLGACDRRGCPHELSAADG